MNPRRADQLTRAAKLRANVSVLLGEGNGAPTVVELAAVKRAQLERSSRVYVQVLSWIDDRNPVEYPVVNGTGDWPRATEEQLARCVDIALDAFEARPKRQAGSAAT